MKDFWIKVISLMLIIGIFFFYNSILDARKKDDEIAKLHAQLEGMQISSGQQSEAKGTYQDGTYLGKADGFGGEIEVEVQIKSGKIETVTITSAEKEDGAYLEMAKEILPEILEAQSIQVDTVSGATFSSGGIKNAVENALEKAGK